jgi:hypothetical protein
MKTRSHDIVLPTCLAHHLEWASREETQLPAHHTQVGGVVNDINKMLVDRALDGLEKYDSYLQTNNGRDATRDLIEELLDASMYVTQLLMQDDPRSPIKPHVLKRMQAQLFEMLHSLVSAWRGEFEDVLDKIRYQNGDSL